MKPRLALLAAITLCACYPLPAQEYAVEDEVEISAEELDALLGPLALHPDALVALILPATTVPTDIVLAARYLRSGKSVDSLDEQPWDESVRALARYSELIYWLDEELSWAISVGEAFSADPAGVMKSIQRLRAQATAAGTLTSTHQQRVIVEEDIISIVPASRQIIYIPTYDPLVVYSPRYDVHYPTYLRFGFGRPVGAWLRFDCDWWSRRIWCHDWDRHGRHDWDWRRRHYRDRRPEIPGARQWRPREDWRGGDDRRRTHRVEVVAAPRFDASPPVRSRVGERTIQPRDPVSQPPVVRRVQVPRVQTEGRMQDRVGHGANSASREIRVRAPAVERQPRMERVRSVPSVSSPPTVVAPREPTQVRTSIPGPKVETVQPVTPPAPRAERTRSVREKSEH